MYGFSDAASLEYGRSSIARIFCPENDHEVWMKYLMNLNKGNTGNRSCSIPGCQVMSSYIWDAEPGRKVSNGIWSVPRNDGVADGSPKDNFRDGAPTSLHHWLQYSNI